MNLNATLFAQLVVFFILGWFTMRFVWPPIIRAIDERTNKIASGLEFADKTQAEFKNAEAKIEEDLKKARLEIIKLREELRKDVAALAIHGAEEILKREIDEKSHAEILKRLETEL